MLGVKGRVSAGPYQPKVTYGAKLFYFQNYASVDSSALLDSNFMEVFKLVTSLLDPTITGTGYRKRSGDDSLFHKIQVFNINLFKLRPRRPKQKFGPQFPPLARLILS